jgi:conserved repeat domain
MLSGSATDDGLPNPPATLTYTWRKVNGPGGVSFGNTHAAITSAGFSAGGVYTLQLAASDSVLSGGDMVVLTVNKSPVANAGPDQTITLPNTATLSGSGTDDGIPNPPGKLSYTWNKASGPGSVTFADVHAANTTATFAVAGTYSLKLSASDSVFVGTDAATIIVNPDPNPRADLKVTVSDSKATVFAGQKNTYTIVVTNVGPNSANGAVVTDSFPAFFTGVTFTATQAGGATGFTASGSGNINDKVAMPAGGKVTYLATGTISPSASGTVSITASATPPNGLSDPNTANNSATDTDTITFKADLKVTVSDGKTAAVAGQKDTYTIVVTNLGPTNVAGAVIRDSFPATFAGVTFTASQTGGASGFSASGSGNINDTVTMPAASKITYKASGTISASATGSLSNTATVTSPTGVPDPNTANNNATDTDTL